MTNDWRAGSSLVPPIDRRPPAGLTRDEIVAWVVREWSQDYPDYLYHFLEGGVLMGGIDLGQLPMPL